MILVSIAFIFLFITSYNNPYSIEINEHSIINYLQKENNRLGNENFSPKKILRITQLEDSNYFALLHIANNDQIMIELFEIGRNNKLMKVNSASTDQLSVMYIDDFSSVVIFGKNYSTPINEINLSIDDYHVSIDLEIESYLLVYYKFPDLYKSKRPRITLVNESSQEFDLTQ